MRQPDGWVVHWVGGMCAQAPSFDESKATWQQIQRESMAGIVRGDGHIDKYIDIPYSFGVDLAGRILEGRGLANKSAANGSLNYNAHAWAVCVLSGPGNQLTSQAINSVRLLTQESAGSNAAVSYVKGHRDVYSTACPGDEAYGQCPSWQSTLHAAPAPSPADWAAIAKLAAWLKAVTAEPLTAGQKRPEVVTLKELLTKRGYHVDPGELYGDLVVAAVHDFKVKQHNPNTDGRVCGARCATDLLTKQVP
jgi:hypothetical protein